jgi:hypothetical protein
LKLRISQLLNFPKFFNINIKKQNFSLFFLDKNCLKDVPIAREARVLIDALTALKKSFKDDTRVAQLFSSPYLVCRRHKRRAERLGATLLFSSLLFSSLLFSSLLFSSLLRLCSPKAKKKRSKEQLRNRLKTIQHFKETKVKKLENFQVNDVIFL